MPGLNIEKSEKLNVFSKLYVLNLNYVEEISESIFNSLKTAWINFTGNNSINKKDRALEKIGKNLEKLKTIEEKKNNEDRLNRIKKGNEEYLDKIFNHDLLNIKVKRKIKRIIKESNSLSEILLYIMDNYVQLSKPVVIENKKHNNHDIVLPKKKNEVDTSYVVDKDGYAYSNVKIVNDIMVFDSKAFEQENKRYRLILKDSSIALFENPKGDVKLAPFEKKRRLYIQSMLDMEKDLVKLEQKKIDITHPIEKYFKYSKIIADNLYKETNDFNKPQNSVLNHLMNETIRTYGNKKVLSKYDFVSANFIKNALMTDSYVLREFIHTSNDIKVKEYKDFKNINNLVPSILDIYKVVNKKIMKNLGILAHIYLKDLEFCIRKVTQYMNVEEIIKFYVEFKSIIRQDYLNRANGMTKTLIKLQIVICDILVNKLQINEDIVFKEYLKEEKIF